MIVEPSIDRPVVPAWCAGPWEVPVTSWIRTDPAYQETVSGFSGACRAAAISGS